MSGGAHKQPDVDTGKGRARPFLTIATGVVTALEWSGKVIAFAMLTGTFLTLLVNVILRYTAGSGIAWAYEIHAVTLPWLVAGGIVIAAARARNIAILLLPDMLNPGYHRALLFFVHVTIVVIAVSVLWSSQPILRASKFQTLSTLGIKQVWGYASLVYAFAAMAVIAALNTVRVMIVVPKKSDPEHSSLS
ncbi:MAG: TRAP transporter small permease subunit [Roseovarius sp.]|nr:TRAP transporter small permease subunit [Roseovarius sp.]